MKISLTVGWKALAIASVALVVVLASAYAGSEYYTSRSPFCGGSCHIINEQHEAWKKSKHYAPDDDRA